jgi:lipoate-protein ligase A
MNMAIDEALLATASTAALRIYGWREPSVSFGYFTRYNEAREFAGNRGLVRRWTGGGIVPHGHDLTYSLVLPASEAASYGSATSLYDMIHSALQCALLGSGKEVQLFCLGEASRISGAAREEGNNSKFCFAQPVRGDVMLDGRKIAGASQRRTHRGILQQGSIQGLNLAADFGRRFAGQLSLKLLPGILDETLIERAQAIAAEKYATEAWLRRR